MKNLLIILLIIAISSCRSLPYKIVHNWNKGWVDEFGNYYCEKENMLLHVYDQKGILGYQLLINNKVVLQAREDASIYQRWDIFLDKNNNLWIESTDVGLFVWIRNKDNKYIHYHISDTPKSIKIPKAFADSVSDIDRKYIDSLRKKVGIN